MKVVNEVFKNRNKLNILPSQKLENAAAIMFGDGNLVPPPFCPNSQHCLWLTKQATKQTAKIRRRFNMLTSLTFRNRFSRSSGKERRVQQSEMSLQSFENKWYSDWFSLIAVLNQSHKGHTCKLVGVHSTSPRLSAVSCFSLRSALSAWRISGSQFGTRFNDCVWLCPLCRCLFFEGKV